MIGLLPGTPREIGVALVISGIDTVIGGIRPFLVFPVILGVLRSISRVCEDGEMVNRLDGFWSSRIINLSF